MLTRRSKKIEVRSRFEKSLILTKCSSFDQNNYNKIFCNLTSRPTKYNIMMITCLTTNCNTVVLDKCVFIIMDDIKYEFKNKY